ncbi:MAG: response regulator [Xanthomonadaceae bacterium]|nr:response regulator [Xanthomonadaceae bacterium]
MSDPLFEHAPAALIAVDERLRVAVANRAALRLLGRAVAPPAPLDRIAGDEVGLMVNRLLAQGAGRGVIESEVLDAAGAPQPMRIEAALAGPRVVLSFAPIGEDANGGPPPGWWPTGLVAAAARELRMPLVANLGCVEILTQAPLSESQLSGARTAQDQGRAALARLDALADLARFEAGGVRIDRGALNPIALIEGAVGAISGRAHRVGLSANTVIDPAMPTNLAGDPQWLLRALTLLLDNALRHTRAGGMVLRAKVEERSGLRYRLAFEVQDTGTGVPEELRPHLFEPLTTRTDLSWDRAQGLGISLALVRRIARAMAGDAYFRPAVPGGSVFGFTCDLPLEGTAALTLEPRIAAVRHRRMLLIDPAPIRVAAFLEQRQRWGMDARAMHDGRDAIAALRDGWRPQLALIHQAAPHAFEALDALAGVRVIGVVPVGTPAAKKALPRGRTIEWMSAPLSRDALLSCLAGHPVPALARPEGGEGAGVDTRSLRVLLAEDSDSNRAVLLAQLQRLGVAVDAVATGSDAVRLALQRRYDLVLLDLALPDLAGTNVAEGIRAAGGEGMDVPILAITGSGEPEDRQRALAAGMNDLLAKPLPTDELAAAIEKWTGIAPVGRQLGGDGGSPMSTDLLAQLERDVGAALFDDLLRRFGSELKARCDRLSRAAADLDRAALERESHALKSAARSYGAAAVADVAAAIEGYAKGDRASAAAVLVQTLPELARAAQESIERLLAQRADEAAQRVAHG